MFASNRILQSLAVTLLLTAVLASVSHLAAEARDSQPDSYTGKSIALLEQSFAARKQMVLLESQLEDADDGAIDELEKKLDLAELRHEEAEFQLEILTTGRELSLLLTEMKEDGLQQFVDELQKLLQAHQRLRELGTQHFQTRRNNSEEDADSAEKFESSVDSFEKQRTLLELRVELFFAKDEDDQSLSEELRREIDSIEE